MGNMHAKVNLCYMYTHVQTQTNAYAQRLLNLCKERPVPVCKEPLTLYI